MNDTPMLLVVDQYGVVSWNFSINFLQYQLFIFQQEKLTKYGHF